jgi:hypothetical protein
MATNSIKLLTGNSHPQLARLVADRYVFLFLRRGGGGEKLVRRDSSGGGTGDSFCFTTRGRYNSRRWDTIGASG